jgi:hypothetical protein
MNANYRRLPHFVAMLAFTIVASAAAIRADGNLKLTGTSTMTNPCNGELVTGVVEVVLGVHANANGHVKVHRSFHGTLEGDEGNTYQVSSIANKQFDNTFPFFYVIEGTNHVTGLGDGPDFDVETRIRVDVDEDQQPVGYAAMVTSATCKAG